MYSFIFSETRVIIQLYKQAVFLHLLNLTLVPFSVFSQPIISKAKPQLLKTHFLPLMDKLKKVSLILHLILLFE